MEKFVIHGGKPLKGTIEVRGGENAAFPILVASILTKEDCIVKNLPLVEDIFRTLEILESMGASVQWIGKRTVKINTKKSQPIKNQKGFGGEAARVGIVFWSATFAISQGKLAQPGGDIIGARPIHTHLDAFSQLGVKVSKKGSNFEMAFSGKFKSNEVILNEFSVTATENILLFLSAFKKKITLKIADHDYQVQELIKALKKMGVHIQIQGSHAIAIEGKKNLKGMRHTLLYDPIEAGTFIILAAATKGNVLVQNVEVAFLELFLKKLRDFGVLFKITGKNVRVKSSKSIVIDKIQSFIYPGIHSDLQSSLGVLATQTKGSTLLHDPLYEGRLKYLEELTKMGAEIYFSDPHRAIINGPTKLRGSDLGTFDLRGGAALIIAALIAEGKSTISNIYQVDRGYEKIEERLQKLGADIKRISNS